MKVASDALLDAYTDLGLSMICVEAALKRGWPDKAMQFATDALKKLDVTLKSLHQREVSCNEITKRMLALVETPASNAQHHAEAGRPIA
jgi:hypothetical protein